MRTAASIARLCEIKDVTDTDAKLIRAIWKAPDMAALTKVYPAWKSVFTGVGTRAEVKRSCIDRIAFTYGVEYLGDLRRGCDCVYYCNGGDTYATTVLFIGDRLIVGCIGDYADKVRQPVQL